MLLLLAFVCLASNGISSQQVLSAKEFYLQELLQRHDGNKDGVLSIDEFDSTVQAFINQCQEDLEEKEDEIYPIHCTGDFSDANYTDCINRMCPDGKSLYNVYGLSADRSVGPGLLGRILPAVVYAVSQGNCRRQNASTTEHHKPTKSEVWGYSLAFASLIIIASNIGALLVPIMNTTYYKLVLMFMVALAVGCMTGTSLFVLMPEAYDLMNVPETAETYLWKAGTVVFIIYFFFLVERVMNLVVNSKQKEKKSILGTDVNMTLETVPLEKKPLDGAHNGVENHGHSHGVEIGEDGKPRVATVAWMVLAGDALHNFMDGLAIGAGFTESVILGLSISIAVIFEEIPHELGDIAILVHSGLSAKKALFYNFIAAATIYAGVIIGIFLGENTSANQWVYAAASGMFLYVSLVDMLPEVNRTGDSAEGQALGPIKVCFIQNLGLLLGLGLIFILANYSGSFFE